MNQSSEWVVGNSTSLFVPASVLVEPSSCPTDTQSTEEELNPIGAWRTILRGAS